MFWGCIGPNGVGRLVICKDRMDASSCVTVLQNNLLQSTEDMFGEERNRFIFQQDNAPPHHANITKNFLRDQGIDFLPWPAQSPDFNIIKNVWLYMKNKINFDSCGAPKTKDELMTRGLEEWSNIPSTFIAKLYEAIPLQFVQVLRAHGYPTKY